jgi:carboxymethylenebutenolidase
MSVSQMESIACRQHDDHFSAYVSEPDKPNGHAVVVLQEIFGLTAQVRQIADRFAEDGYLAYAPDLFWRMERGVQLSHSKEDIARAFGFLERYKTDDGLADITSTVAHIRARPGMKGQVAVAGMCLGGKLAYLAATLPCVNAAVGFYGVGIEKCLDVAGALQCPLLLHFGDQDRYVPIEAREQIAQALAGQAVETFLYPGADHGFYTRGGQADIALARQRTGVFLQRALQG